MQRRQRRIARIVPALAIFALVGMAATSPFPNARAAAEQNGARQWVAAHIDRLPKTLDAIAALPVAYRKAIVINLADSEREAIWRAHLESFVKPRAELSATQQNIRDSLGITLNETQVAFIQETLASLHGGIGEGTTTEAKKAYAAAVCKKAQTLFSKPVAFRITATIGVAAPMRTPVAKASLINSATDAIRGATVVLGLRHPLQEDCVCSVNSLCDCIGGTCVYSDCKPSWAGCGCMYVFECDGKTCFAAN